ncbi:MAG: YggS family pyridoxal phosphate-dependent enzyme [Anaerovoracaceae bacterium]
MEHIVENIKEIKKTLREGVLLVAVTKTHTPEEINVAIDGGITDIGENKVQEILDKYDLVKPVKWHLIGHLQTNKVKYIIDKVSMIHSVDSYKLAKEIQKRAKNAGITMDILIQVNSAEEESKFGVSLEETKNLINEILETCPNINIKGLMCIAPFESDTENVREYFEAVRKQYDEYKNIEHPNLEFKYLSMGMSHDYIVAMDEGSNLVRVGSAIFGRRVY